MLFLFKGGSWYALQHMVLIEIAGIAEQDDALLNACMSDISVKFPNYREFDLRDAKRTNWLGRGG